MKSDKQVKNELSRRDFVKTTAIGATALAGLGSKDAAAAQFPRKWHYEAEVVVVGFGGAGGAAAWEALKAGAKTIILERMDKAGGNTDLCEGHVYMGGGTPLQKSFGITNDSRDNMYNYYLAAAREGADPHLISVFCDKSLELYDWLTNTIGVKWGAAFQDDWPAKPVSGTVGMCWSGEELSAEFAAVATPAPRSHLVAAQGSGLFQPLKAAVLKLGARVLYKAQGKKLIVNPQTGRVAGVMASYQGSEIYVKAKKGVVLTTGGFAANAEMVASHAPALKGLTPLGTAGDDGSGIKMGQEIGADVRTMQYATVIPQMGAFLAYSNWGSALGSIINGVPCQLKQGILVDKNGQRYMPEDHGEGIWEAEVQCLSPLASLHTSYLIIDSRIYSQIGGFFASVASFIAAKANTIHELALALKTAPGVLEDTVRFYNKQAENGEDPLFNKLKKYVIALATPPFYAVSRQPGFFITNCGLRKNTKSQVLDTTGRPIPGLYAAGRASSGILSQNYAGSGSSTADCLTFGRIAGQNAAA